ncbi:unnamed protein product [Prorocentrum cordatum]|uniref:PDZ domain-containing protein n=1 Tax=Prorocentrum cordatum TaxID=2364126 RepID=A0ABN9U1R1_9DINO|nr:unnamed protein product [Polarella glacialis]
MFSCCTDTRATDSEVPLQGPVSEEEVKKSWAKLPETFEVEVAHASGAIGLDIGHHEAKCLKIKGVRDGSVGKHNKAHPDKALKEGDFILAANGVKGVSTDILAEMKKKQKSKKLQLLVSRGAPVDEPVACRLRCAWKDEGTYYLNAASDPSQREVQCYTLESEWSSEKWFIHDAGKGFKRIQNQWTGKYLNWVEDGTGVALSEYNESYDSMLWKPDSNVSTSGAFKYQNKYKTDLYLNMNDGSGPSRSVGLTTDQSVDFLSAQWLIEPFVSTGGVSCKLQCAWTDGGTYYLNAANDPRQSEVQCYILDSQSSEWTSMRWWVYDVGDGYYRIQNQWTKKFLNWVKDGSGVALSEYNESYDSMLWKQDSNVSTSGAFKYQNKYKTDLYLNMSDGSGPSRSVGLTTDQSVDFLSAQWLIQNVEAA